MTTHNKEDSGDPPEAERQLVKKNMKAALFYGTKEDMRVETVPVPEISGSDILLKVRTCGICGSDARSYFRGIEKRYKIPVIFGHELIADVCEVGDKTSGYEPGDRVVVAPIYGCGRCEFCVSGRENICENAVVFGCTHDGGFAEYMKIPGDGVERGVLVKVGNDVTDTAAPMIEAFSCCLHGLRRLDIQSGNTVAIFGSGPIGLAHMILAKKLGAGNVAIIDLVDNRLQEAVSFGADITINSTKADWKNRLLNHFGKNGVDNVITAAPSVAAIESGLEIVKHGGNLLIFGGLPHGSMLNMDLNNVHYNEITITGSIDATIDDFTTVVSMAPSLGIERFITHTFSLGDVKEGMETIKKKEGLKVILKI